METEAASARRRSTRVRAPPALLAAEQEHSAALSDARSDWLAAQRLLQLGDDSPGSSSSDEEPPPVDGTDSDEEKRDEGAAAAADAAWSDTETAFSTGRFSAPVPLSSDEAEPLPLLQLFLAPRLMQQLAHATTAYARAKGAAADWTTDADELYRLVAVHLAMGIVRLPSMRMYWQEGYAQPFVASLMSRDRFLELRRYFHCVGPSTSAVPQPPLAKLQPLLADLRSRCSRVARAPSGPAARATCTTSCCA